MADEWECPTCTAMNPQDETKSPCQACGEPYFDPWTEEAGDLQHGDTVGIGLNDLEAYVVGRKSITTHPPEVMLVLMVPPDTKFRFISREVDGRDGVGRSK